MGLCEPRFLLSIHVAHRFFRVQGLFQFFGHHAPLVSMDGEIVILDHTADGVFEFFGAFGKQGDAVGVTADAQLW